MAMQKSVALAWSGMEEAPVIVASGKGAISEKMLEIAKKCGITIVEDPILADILTDTDIGTCVPRETWSAVAAIFAFLENGFHEKLF